jgi:hypothetical protein
MYYLNVYQVSSSFTLQTGPGVSDRTRHIKIRDFRDRHWRFIKEYVIRRSSYGVARWLSPPPASEVLVIRIIFGI